MFSPYDSIQCTPSATYGLDKQVFKNWNPYVNQPMTLPVALAESCDTYFYEIGNRFYERGNDGRTRMQQWARRFGFGAPTGIDLGGEASGLVPTPEWRKKTFKSDWDRAWNPGDSIQLAIGQKEVRVTPLQMARFYAMIANGGKLVTPYVVSGASGRLNRRRPVTHGSSRPIPARRRRRPGRITGGSRRSLGRNHSANGTSSGVFGVPISISGSGTAEKVVNCPDTPPDISRISRGGAATDGFRRCRAGRLCRDRERRPRVVSPPAARPSSRSTSTRRLRPTRLW